MFIHVLRLNPTTIPKFLVFLAEISQGTPSHSWSVGRWHCPWSPVDVHNLDVNTHWLLMYVYLILYTCIIWVLCDSYDSKYSYYSYYLWWLHPLTAAICFFRSTSPATDVCSCFFHPKAVKNTIGSPQLCETPNFSRGSPAFLFLAHWQKDLAPAPGPVASGGFPTGKPRWLKWSPSGKFGHNRSKIVDDFASTIVTVLHTVYNCTDIIVQIDKKERKKDR
jgi:hypothetical protein